MGPFSDITCLRWLGLVGHHMLTMAGACRLAPLKSWLVSVCYALWQSRCKVLQALWVTVVRCRRALNQVGRAQIQPQAAEAWQLSGGCLTA